LAQEDIAEAEQPSVTELIDTVSLKGYGIVAPLLCSLLMITEGIDAFGIGFVGPYISREHGIPPENLGVIYTGTVLSSLIGATLIAPRSDRLGRRPILLWGSLVMGPATVLTAFADNLPFLFVLRFIIGLAFGAAFPVVLALVADYAPKRWQSTLMMMMNSSIALGSVIAGIMAAIIIPTLGWQAFLFVSAGLSFLCTAVVWLMLPESLHHMLRVNPGDPRALKVIRRLIPRGPLVTPFAAPLALKADRRGNFLSVVLDGRIVYTLLIWFISNLCSSLVLFVSFWMPAVLLNEGVDISITGFIVSGAKLAGVFGAIVCGWIADRSGLPRTITFTFFATSIAVLAVGNLMAWPVLAVIVLFLAFALENPSVSGVQMLILKSYPEQLRATAVGWIGGIGRLTGGSIGTMAGGYMVGAGWRVREIMPVIAAISFVAGLGLILLRMLQKRQGILV
jgi:AAHS family 4-hydroxybenzoate transporter-like MFS transporter